MDKLQICLLALLVIVTQLGILFFYSKGHFWSGYIIGTLALAIGLVYIGKLNFKKKGGV